MKFYYSIRVVEANSKKEAVEKVQINDFREDHKLCDAVLTKTELLLQVAKSQYFKPKTNNRHGRK